MDALTRPTWFWVASPCALAVAFTVARGPAVAADEEAHLPGFESIVEEDVQAHLTLLCSPYLEGRDSPSEGLSFTADYIAGLLGQWGFEGAFDGGFVHGYTRELPGPNAGGCRLGARGEAGLDEFKLGVDFVPLPAALGEAKGELVFCGYGIGVRGFDEVRGLPLKGKVAIFAHGEPRHPKALDGPELTPAANVYRKLDRLADEGAVGALVVRRDPPADVERPEGWPEMQPMGFRRTWAIWNGERPDAELDSSIPALEISEAVARKLLGDLYDQTLAEIDEGGKPVRVETPEVEIDLAADVDPRQEVELPNIVARLHGTDEALAGQVVILGAHMDHIGADPRGRIGTGADDNASGVSALLEVAQALSLSRPRRDVIVAVFSSEEDGLLGSRALVDSMRRGVPLATSEAVAMVNLDMLGRGSAKSVNVIGSDESRDLDRLLTRAKRFEKTGLSKVITGEGAELWMRSDHYPFFVAGIPVLFLFEETPISNNKDYHTWRDTPDLVDPVKIARSARLAFNLIWLLGVEDDVPDRPEDQTR
ncbi:M28 family peptidase [Engelhardtia mirabilis]